MIQGWRRPGIPRRIGAVKPGSVEKRGFGCRVAGEYAYRERAVVGEGGLSIGVCRGMLSEGIDLSDAQVRVVFRFRIPYASFNSAEVQ